MQFVCVIIFLLHKGGLMLNKFKKYLRFLLSGSFALIIAACYGIIAQYDNDTKSFRTTDSSEEPIPGLKMTLSETTVDTNGVTNVAELGSDYGDSDGVVYFTRDNWVSDYSVLIEDMDGSVNGSWKSTNLSVGIEDYHTEIIMEVSN